MKKNNKKSNKRKKGYLRGHIKRKKRLVTNLQLIEENTVIKEGVSITHRRRVVKHNLSYRRRVA